MSSRMYGNLGQHKEFQPLFAVVVICISELPLKDFGQNVFYVLEFTEKTTPDKKHKLFHNEQTSF